MTTTANDITHVEDEQITREYECAYLLVPEIPEEKLTERVEDLKRVFSDNGAELAVEKQPERTPLAYEMKIRRGGKTDRYLEGYFGWVTMEAEPQAVNAIKEQLRGNDKLIRFMIITAPKDQEPEGGDSEENTEVNEEELVSPQSTEEQQKQGGASTEEIDKSIDELVGEEEAPAEDKTQVGV